MQDETQETATADSAPAEETTTTTTTEEQAPADTSTTEQATEAAAPEEELAPAEEQPKAAELPAAEGETQVPEEDADTPQKFIDDFHSTVQEHSAALEHLKQSSNATIKGTLVNQAIEKFETTGKKLEDLLARLKKNL